MSGWMPLALLGLHTLLRNGIAARARGVHGRVHRAGPVERLLRVFPGRACRDSRAPRARHARGRPSPHRRRPRRERAVHPRDVRADRARVLRRAADVRSPAIGRRGRRSSAPTWARTSTATKRCARRFASGVPCRTTTSPAARKARCSRALPPSCWRPPRSGLAGGRRPGRASTAAPCRSMPRLGRWLSCCPWAPTRPSGACGYRSAPCTGGCSPTCRASTACAFRHDSRPSCCSRWPCSRASASRASSRASVPAARIAACAAALAIILLEGTGGAMPLAFLTPHGRPDRAAYTWVRDGGARRRPRTAGGRARHHASARFSTSIRRCFTTVPSSTARAATTRRSRCSWAVPRRRWSKPTTFPTGCARCGKPVWAPSSCIRRRLRTRQPARRSSSSFKREMAAGADGGSQVTSEAVFPGVVVYRLAEWREAAGARAGDGAPARPDRRFRRRALSPRRATRPIVWSARSTATSRRDGFRASGSRARNGLTSRSIRRATSRASGFSPPIGASAITRASSSSRPSTAPVAPVTLYRGTVV